MSFEPLKDFLKDVWEVIRNVFTSRIVPFIILAVALFSVLIYRLFVLQIVNGDTYTTTYTLKSEKTVTTVGTRGKIYDCNGVLLAYSELAYCVEIADSGYYSTTKEHYYALNEIIAKTAQIIEDNGDSLSMDFSIGIDERDNYYYKVSDNALLRFLRDMYGKSSISELSDEQRNSTAYDVVDYLKKIYKVDPSYDKYRALQIVYVRFNLAQSTYSRYLSFTIADNISDKTLAAIVENEDILTGVTIGESTIRKYNYAECMSHILGYTGKINFSELESLQAVDPSYTQNDVVGKAGIEAQYETTLAGTKGSITMIVDNLGRILETTEVVESAPGADVYLTIDVKYQQKLYDLLERRLAEVVAINLTDKPDVYQMVGEDTYIFIPITHVVNALVQNNVISIDEIATSDSIAATTVYNTFSETRNAEIEAIKNELGNPNVYNTLSDHLKEYITMIRSDLINSGILNSEAISENASSDLAKKWSNGELTFKEYIEGAINEGWVNTYNLDLENTYSTTDEVYKAVMDVALAEILEDDAFDKYIYEYLILNYNVSATYLTLILMEQGAIECTESEYVSIANGASLYNFYYDKILNLAITPAQLALDPCSGSICVEDPNTGSMYAIVSYPGYDINKFSGTIDSKYYADLLADLSTPLVSRATMTRIAPGSTFKPLIAIAAINEGLLSPTELIECKGIFEEISPGIKCWFYPYEHGNLDLENGLFQSCNVYFTTLGYRLSFNDKGQLDFKYGLSVEKKYTDLLGLSTKTGIQIPEATPHASDYNPVVSAIGQGTNQYTSLNMTRYVSTLANGGTVYDSNIIKKIVYNSGKVIEIQPVSTPSGIDPSVIENVYPGMYRVINEGMLGEFIEDLPVSLYAKSGTAQESLSRADHAIYITFSKDASGMPDLAVACMIPYGHGSVNAGIMNVYAFLEYYGLEFYDHIFYNVRYGIQYE